MKIQFLGAAKVVTGSCHLLKIDNKNILLDCGLFQGGNIQTAMNIESFSFEPSDIDYVLLSHAHIDHSGRIPKLYKEGFRGKVITTKATADLCQIMLPDSGHIQEIESQWLNKKREKAGKHEIRPIYTVQDTLDCLTLFERVFYDEIIEITPNIKVKFTDAGHMLGSAIIEIWVNENGIEQKIVYTGDLGNQDLPILRDPSIVESADYLIMESTYGNRNHNEVKSGIKDFIDIMKTTIINGGKVIIPSFAVGRTQEIIYSLYKYREEYEDDIKWLESVPVYVDSPLAISATEVFRQNLDCYDEEAKSYIKDGKNPLDFTNLRFTRTADESKILNTIEEPCVIISASGMCEAGRIKHHLSHNLWKSDSTIIFVGYQAEGTLGRKILEGYNKVRILGEDINVKAKVVSIKGFSGHADQKGLISWINSMKVKPKNIFIVHGEEEQQLGLKNIINDEFGINTIIPSMGDIYTIENGNITNVDYNSDIDIYTYTRLRIIDDIILLNEELEEMTDIVRHDLKNVKTDKEITELKEKLKRIEDAIVNVIR